MADALESNLYGSASLYTGGYDLSAAFDEEGSTSIPLGHNRGNRNAGVCFNLGPGGDPGHALTFGATRSGKGVNVINVALLTYVGSVVAIDPKGELAWISGDFRRKLGQRIVILDPWDEVNKRYGVKAGVTEHITRFNPLSALDPRSPDFADDVMAIADALIIPNKGGRDAHWTDSARELVAGLIAAAVEDSPGVGSLRDVRELLTLPDDLLAKAVAELQGKNPQSLAARKLQRFTKATPEISAVRSTALTQTALLDSQKLMDAMETDDDPFDMDELVRGAVTIYLVLPPDRLQTHGRWMRMLLTLAIRTIARQATHPPEPVLFMLDEMGTVGSLSMIEQSYGLMAGLGLRIWGFLQDLSQLQRDYESWETFISNSSIIQVLNVGDQTTAKYISEYLGSSTVEVNKGFSKRVRPRREGVDPNNPYKSRLEAMVHGASKSVASSLGKGGGGSDAFLEKEVWEPELAFHGRPLLFPWEVRAIPRTESLIIAPGLFNAQLERFTYYSDPVFSPRARHDPNKPPPKIVVPPSPPAFVPVEPPKQTHVEAFDKKVGETVAAVTDKVGSFLNKLGKH